MPTCPSHFHHSGLKRRSRQIFPKSLRRLWNIVSITQQFRNTKNLVLQQILLRLNFFCSKPAPPGPSLHRFPIPRKISSVFVMKPWYVYTAFFTAVASWFFSMIRFRNLRFDLRILAGYLTACVLMGSLQYLYALHYGNNLWLSYLFTPIEFGILAWLLSFWEEDGWKRHGMQLSTIFFALLCLASTVFIENIRLFGGFTRPLECLMLALFSGRILRLQFHTSETQLFTRPQFWVSTAILIYFSGLAVLYSLSNALLGVSMDVLRAAWMIHAPLNIFANICYGAAIACPQTR